MYISANDKIMKNKKEICKNLTIILCINVIITNPLTLLPLFRPPERIIYRMDNAELKSFVAEIVGINSQFPKMTTFSPSGSGMITAQQTSVNSLKKSVLALAAETHKKQPDKYVVDGLFNEVEGGLQMLHSLGVIDNSTLGKLIGKLYLLKT